MLGLLASNTTCLKLGSLEAEPEIRSYKGEPSGEQENGK